MGRRRGASDGRMKKLAVSLVLLALAGCNGPGAAPDTGTSPGTDAAPGVDTGVDAGAEHDAATLDDAWAPGVDASSAVCMPTGGTAMVSPGCDLLQLAVIEHDGAPSELVLTGRIYPVTGTDGECAVVDGVDIVQDSASSTVIQHLEGGTSVLLDSAESEIARGVPSSAIAAACATDDPAVRFDSYGIVVHGRVDGGTFEARCARAEGGGRWPPALRITCHRNVESPAYGGNAIVSHGSFMGHTIDSTMLYAAASHGPTGALTSVDATIHVIPRRSIFDTGAPLAPFDTTGWTGSANESGTTPSYSQLQAFASTLQFDMDLCPPPMTGTPGPDYVPPPVFLARFTGTGGHGTYATEAYVGVCTTTSTP
jgi:hypothetical protein